MIEVSLSDRFQKIIGPLANKISTNKYMLAIRDGMLAYMPFTFIASIFLIIAFFPITPYIDFMTNIFGSDWQMKLTLVASASLDVGGLLVVIAVANSMANNFKVNNIQAILTAVVSFLLLTPQDTMENGTFLEVTRISAQAIFLSILVGIITVVIYKKVTDKNWKIKMPASVPPAVSVPFESIIPSFITITVFFIVRLFLDITLNTDALTLVNTLLGRPLSLFGGSLFGIVFVLIFEQLLWFFGIHGGAIVGAVMDPIHQVLEDQNRLASIAGEIPPNIISMSFRANFASIGIIGSVIAIIIVAKSRQYKEVGKVAGVPYIFNIGEPVLFGVPLMLNFIYFIPFVFTRVISAVIAYVAFALEWVPVPTGLAQVPWTTPPIISGYLVTGSIRGAILQIVLLVFVTLLWIPFVKIADKQVYEQELEREQLQKKR